MSGAKAVVDKLCQFFGGPYDTTTHTYRTPQFTVTNLDGPVFRRAEPKRDDKNTDYQATGAAGHVAGCLAWVVAERGEEKRVAMAGASSGLKQVRWAIRIHCFFRSGVTFAEDLQDIVYDTLDGFRGRIEADRTAGTGGFEAGYGVGFQIGEGGEPWLKWTLSPVATVNDLSKAYMVLEFSADQYVQA